MLWNASGSPSPLMAGLHKEHLGLEFNHGWVWLTHDFFKLDLFCLWLFFHFPFSFPFFFSFNPMAEKAESCQGDLKNSQYLPRIYWIFPSSVILVKIGHLSSLSLTFQLNSKPSVFRITFACVHQWTGLWRHYWFWMADIQMIAHEQGHRFVFYEKKFSYRKDEINFDYMTDRIWVKTVLYILYKVPFPYDLKYPRLMFKRLIHLLLDCVRKYTTERLSCSIANILLKQAQRHIRNEMSCSYWPCQIHKNTTAKDSSIIL